MKSFRTDVTFNKMQFKRLFNSVMNFGEIHEDTRAPIIKTIRLLYYTNDDGTETTATTMCFVSVVLGIFPEIQQQLYEEILNVVGPDEKISIRNINKLEYTERVIKETLRLFPTAPIFGRQLSADIPMGDFTFPEGTTIGISVINLHRNPKYWHDPLKFDPDRFLPEEVAKRHPSSYIPFSYGMRNCIGARFAMLSMKAMLTLVVRQFKIHTEYKSTDEIVLKLDTFLRMKDGPKLRLESR